MITFIVYEDNDIMSKNYVRIIKKFMFNKHINYKVLIFNKFDSSMIDLIKNNTDSRKVYLLDIEVPKMDGIDLAREIRNSGDWNSQIMIITADDKKDYFLLTNRLMLLNFILKSDLEKELLLSLDTVYKIFFNDGVLSFKYNGEIFNILYNDIYYIEKNINDNSSTVVTKDSKYTIRNSINALLKELGDDNRFFKSHRSCIINMNNVLGYDINNNIIKFSNREINLVARNKKKEFKRKLLNRNIVF